YGLHIMRRFGNPTVVSATATQRTPGVDESCDVELTFPSGATGLSTNSMVAEDYSFTLRVIGTRGEAFVHNFVKPHEDDRLT
ncbi:gfo/Idh/MocA family oxidoreductase, partial [Mycobacterium sp. ITM-2017-0098]